MSSTLAAFSDELAGAVERAAPFVVGVNGRRRIASSGVLWRAGVIVAAEHSLKRDEDLSVVLADGRKVPATLAGRDPGTDLAVLKIDGRRVIRIRYRSFRQDRQPSAGRGAIPGDGRDATMGVISAVGGPWTTGAAVVWTSTSASTCPLSRLSAAAQWSDTAGRLLGIATSALSARRASPFRRRPLDRVTGELLSKGRVARGYLGVGLQPVGLPEHLITKLKLSVSSGLIVLTAEPGGPADRAGCWWAMF